MPDTAEIYALLDPRDQRLRYIGKANNSAKRLASHIRDSRRRNTPVLCWIRSLCAQGLVPIVKVLITVEYDRWKEYEVASIQIARRNGHSLLNVADGGDEPYCPKEVRAENGRRAAKARASTPEQKRIWKLKLNMGQALRDGFVSNERRARLRETARAVPELFGCFANIPDREEHPDGSPVHEPGRRSRKRN